MMLRVDTVRPRRYLAVGGLCALLNNVALVAGDAIGLHYMAVAILAFLLVTPTAYLLHSAYTFGERRSWQALLRFTGGLALGVPLFFAVMVLLCSGLRLPMVIAAPLATAVLFLWNSMSARWAIVGRLAAKPL